MGLRKNTITDIADNGVVYTIDTPEMVDGRTKIGFYRQNLPTVTTGVSGGYNATFVQVPVDMIVYGRSAETAYSPGTINGIANNNTIPTSGQIGHMFKHENNAVSYGIGLHCDYFYQMGNTGGDQLSYPSRVLSQNYALSWGPTDSTGKQFFMSGYEWKTRWGFLEGYSVKIDTLVARQVLDYIQPYVGYPPFKPVYKTVYDVSSSRTIANNIITITDDWTEIEKEIKYDWSLKVIHYISLIRYKFIQKALTDSTGIKKVYDDFYVNVLVDFKFDDVAGQSKLVGIDILNDNFQNAYTEDSGCPNPATGSSYKWTMSYDVGTLAPMPFTSVKLNYKTNTPYTQTGGDFPLKKHYVFHPSVTPNKQIESFSTFHCPSGIGLIYRHTDNSNRYFYYNPTQSFIPSVDWRTTRLDRSYWVPDNREPSRSLYKADCGLRPVWSVNPSGIIDPNLATAIPVDEPVYQTYNSQPVSHTICGIQSRDVEHKITLYPGKYLEIRSALFPPSFAYNIGPTRYPSSGIDSSLAVNARELACAGITYTDTNGKEFYVVHIITTQYLFMYVIYENGRSKIYRFPRTTNSLQVIGVKNDGPIANNYVCQTLWKPDSDSPLKFGAFKVSLPAALPTLSLGVDPKTHTYFLQAVFQSTEMAKWAYMRLVQKTCFIELDTGESIDFIYNLMNPPTSTTVRIPLDLLKYMRDNPSVSLSNVTINLISWDLYLPFVVSVDGSLDARPLALGDMTFDFNGTWPLMPSFSSGVIHVEKDYITDGLFAINCTGLMDNVKEIQFTWGVDNSNWIDENAQAVSSPYTYTFDTPSEFFNSPVPSHFLVAAAADENQFMVRLPYASPNKKSVTDGSAAGMTHYGTMVTFVSKVYEKKSYFLPPITVYDKHKFMLGDIYTDNLVEVDNIIDNTFNAPAFPGKFFIPTMNDTGIYSLSFNFRVAPNYLDYDNKFTLFYENSSGHPVQDRLSTPMIKKWWIVGLPYRESGEPYIYEVGTRPRGEADIPGPGAGKISDILTEYDGITDTSRENFNETHGYFKEAIDRGSPGRQLRSMSYMYLHDEYCDRIVDHVENVAAGTDSIYDIGTVYCSGYNTIPSGFMDFHNQKFTSTYNGGVLSSGVVPVGTYGIFLIVEDTLGHRTGLDLIKCTNLGAINYFPTLASFNYGV